MKSFELSREVDASSVGDRVVLYHRGSKKALVLNPSGTFLWGRLESPRTLQELAAALAERYPGLDEQQALRDAEAFLAELETHGMLAPATS